jgi:hypothetical protein
MNVYNSAERGSGMFIPDPGSNNNKKEEREEKKYRLCGNLLLLSYPPIKTH